MKIKNTSAQSTNIILGIIAAEVVYLTVQAFADRQLAAGKCFPSADQTKPQKAPVRFLFMEALHHVTGLLRSLFSDAKTDMIQGAPRLRRRLVSLRPQHEGGTYSDGANEEPEEEGIDLKGSMQGIAAKLKDPAWAGVLAANDGNISLTDAERAVPMPDSAKFVERLDKNPFIGKGMKAHSRNEHISKPFSPQVFPGVTGDR